MRPFWSFVWIAIAATCASAQEKKEYPTLGTIERLDPRLDKLIPPDSKIERLADGFEWTEGPLWMSEGNLLLFCDIPQNTVFQWTEDGGVTPFLKPSGYTGTEPRGGEPGSNGLLLNRDRRLVLMQHGDRRVAKLDTNRGFTTIVDKYDGKKLNSPNDGVYDSKGNLFFTDPPYGLPQGKDDPTKEQPFNGVYRLSSDDKLTLLTRDMTFPNGIALSPDEKTLYVANSDPAKAIWMAYPLNEDGTLGEGKVFADVTDKVGKVKGLPDGLKVDQDGNLFATGPGGVLIFAPDGTHLGTLATGEATANCAWGGDGSVLYITADMYLARVKTSTKGKKPLAQ